MINDSKMRLTRQTKMNFAAAYTCKSISSIHGCLIIEHVKTVKILTIHWQFHTPNRDEMAQVLILQKECLEKIS